MVEIPQSAAEWASKMHRPSGTGIEHDGAGSLISLTPYLQVDRDEGNIPPKELAQQVVALLKTTREYWRASAEKSLACYKESDLDPDEMAAEMLKLQDEDVVRRVDHTVLECREIARAHLEDGHPLDRDVLRGLLFRLYVLFYGADDKDQSRIAKAFGRTLEESAK